MIISMKRHLTVLLTSLLCFGLLACKQIPYGENDSAGKYYLIRGIKMYCETYGSGEPLLLIHGNNGSINTFSGIIPHLSKNYKVIVADSRSQGRSLDEKDSISFEMMADDYAALLDSMHIGSANIIGWSDGGINALLLAIRHPDKVKKIISSGANLWPDSTAISSDEWKSEQARFISDKNKVKISGKEKNDWKLFLLDWNQPNIPLYSLHCIKCPVLIVCGEHDLIKRDHSLLIHQNISQSILWIVPASGHGTFFDQKRKFLNKVDDFLINSR